MMKRSLMIVIVGFLVMPGKVFGQASSLSVEEIVNKANLASYYAGADGQADVKMTITDGQGRQRLREFRILRLDIADGGDQRFYVYFQKPTDVTKMVFMVWKHPGQDDDRWLYLPALDLVNRIAASDKRSSFVGSHFVYEDVSGRGIEQDVHELLVRTEEYYLIRNTPKQSKEVEFAYYDVRIDVNTFMPMKAEYFDAQGNLIRSTEVLEIQEIQGQPTVIKSIARDLVRQGETVMEFSQVRYDVGLTENIFKERYLRKAPRQWLQ